MSRKRRIWLIVLLLTICLIGLTIAIPGLSWTAELLGIPALVPVGERSLPGTYVAHYTIRDLPAGRDTLVLRPDHTFVQTCVLRGGRVMRVSGTWGMGYEFSFRRVVLNGVLRPAEDTADGVSWDRRRGGLKLGTERRLSSLALVVSDDEHIRFWKVK